VPEETMATARPLVFVVDDEPTVCVSVSRLVRSVGFDVLTFNTAGEFLRANRPDVPGCLVLDVRLPELSGLDLQQELAKSNIDLPVIFVTGHADIPMSVRAMKAGAVEFLTKPFREQDLLEAIQHGVGRHQQLRQQRSEVTELQRRYAVLTPREREVFPLVTAGMLNKQIAGQLGASEKTVKIHRGQVMRKMQAKSLADLVRISQKLGLTGQIS
jgi:FixJ family two-component response regulator